MNRFMKFIGIMFIAIVVSFIICDEKGIKFERKNSKIIIHKQQNNYSSTGKVELKPVAVYKNSDYIKINPEFENPKTLHKSLYIDKDAISKKEKEKENRIKSVSSRGDSVTSILTEYNETNTGTTTTRTRNRATRTGFTVTSTGTTSIKTGTTTMKTGNTITRTRTTTTNTGNTNNIQTGNIKSKTGTTTTRTGNTTTRTGNTTTRTGNTTTKTGTSVTTGSITTGKNTFTNSRSDFLQKEKKSVKKYEGSGYDLSLKELKEPEETKKMVERYKGTHEDVSLKELVKIETPVEIKRSVEKYEGKTYKLNLGELRKKEQLPEEKSIEIDTGKGNEKNKEIESRNNKNEKIISSIIQSNETVTGEKITEISQENDDLSKEIEAPVFYADKYVGTSIKLSLKSLIKSGSDKKIAEPYRRNYHIVNIKELRKIEQEPVDEEITETEETSGFSEELLSNLLENEEIDVNTLESENDEFLQKIFQETGDPKVMNLILETHLSEYQFTKAKKFIENLSEAYFNQIDPLLYLQICFNSFSLSSNTRDETLRSIIQNYQNNGKISNDDAMRYEGVIVLMNKDYDKFFEISSGFTSQSHIKFVSKLNEYKDQIKTQMGMPDYYFDTLVALELFNQGLFQPAKVISLYSLTQDPNYILPYQVLAYANFLTNSRDTSIEYLKKLTELDPDNVEKYRFLMGIAYYWNEEYEQSVLMLSQIKDQNLRLDTERYLIRDYIILEQKTKLIGSWSKLLGYDDLVSSDFYTYFYETFYHPYAEGKGFDLYLYDRDLADKMIRVCSMKLGNQERVVCNYGEIGKDIALGKFDILEQSLLDLVAEYPQGYLYQALGDYYIQQGDLEKAKVYLLKAISLTQEKSERSQIKKLLQDTM